MSRHARLITTNLRALILYVVQSCATQHQPLSILKLQMICYYADFTSYRQRLQSLTGATYRAQPEGPRPDGFRRTLKQLLRNRSIQRIPATASCRCRPCVTPRHWDLTTDQLVPGPAKSPLLLPASQQ